MGLLAVLVLIAFISRLYGVLRSASGSHSWFPTMALVGGILMTGVRLSEIGFIYPASELDSYGEDTQVAKLLILSRWNSANMLAPPFTARLALLARFPLVYFHDGFVGRVRGSEPSWLGSSGGGPAPAA